VTDSELEAYLRENGYAEHICRAGRAGLIARWRKFAEEVERGYRFGLEDYRNDLDIRGIIALAGLDDEVKDEDTRFRNLLTARDTRVWESGVENAFWDFGYPRNASRQLLKDLRAEGLVEETR